MPLRVRVLFPLTLVLLAPFVVFLTVSGDLRPLGHVVWAGMLLLGIPFALLTHAVWQWQGTSRALWIYTVAGAVLLRLPLAFTPPTLSDDIYRYAWDGRQQRHGLNPYRYAPEAPEVASLRDELWEHINNADVPTIYPPLAEGLFLLTGVVSHSVRAYNLLVVAFDMGLIFALGALCHARGLPRARAVVYAWHPLVLLEIAGSGHNDSIPLCFLVVGLLLAERQRGAWSLVALAASTLTKFAGGMAAPLVALRTPRRYWLVFPAALVLAYVPYAAAGPRLFAGLGTFAAHWEFNQGLFRIGDLGLRALGVADPRLFLKLAFALLGAALLAWLLAKRADPVRGTAVLLAGALLLSPTVHPWYVLWCVPLLALVPSRGLLCWSFTVALAYHVMPAWAADGVWRENLWVVALEYAPVFVLLSLDVRRALRSEAESTR